jgi:hypothetical protein
MASLGSLRTVRRVTCHRFVRLTVETTEGAPWSLSAVVAEVYRTGLDPGGWVVQVAIDAECPTTGCSIAKTTSTPPCSYASADTGAGDEQGDEQ